MTDQARSHTGKALFAVLIVFLGAVMLTKAIPQMEHDRAAYMEMMQ